MLSPEIGHVHAYERSFPVYNDTVRADGITYVVVGDGGNREGLATDYIEPPPAWSAYRRANYGFGMLHVANATHARVDWLEDNFTGNPLVQDSTWISTTQHRQTPTPLMMIS